MIRIKNAVISLFMGGALLASSGGAFAKDASPALELAQQLNQAFIEVAAQASESVVVIEVSQKATGMRIPGESDIWGYVPPELRRYFGDGQGQSPRSTPKNRAPRQHVTGRGSGIIITEDGFILTNNHVVEDADKVKVRLKNGKDYDAEIVGTDPESDIAVIKIRAKGLTVAKIGDSDKTKVGEFAIAIGAPFDLEYSVTVGHVSGKGRSFEGWDPQSYSDQDFIQTDASINPGNSGGPLVNLSGEVIAINSMIRVNSGIGFAIPINLATRVSNHIIKDGKFARSWIGVMIRDLKSSNFKDLDPSLAPDVEEGVIIEQIEPNGPAANSTLKPSDVVISVDGKPVKTSRQLKDAISTKSVGDTVALEVVRGRQRLTVKIKTEAVPSETTQAKKGRNTPNDVETTTLGLTVQALNKELSKQLEVDVTSGVVVTEVDPDSAASDLGIKTGDIITEVNRKPVNNLKDFRAAMKSADPKTGILINLLSNGASKFVVLKETE
jgi:serine protease Do